MANLLLKLFIFASLENFVLPSLSPCMVHSEIIVATVGDGTMPRCRACVRACVWLSCVHACVVDANEKPSPVALRERKKEREYLGVLATTAGARYGKVPPVLPSFHRDSFDFSGIYVFLDDRYGRTIITGYLFSNDIFQHIFYESSMKI